MSSLPQHLDLHLIRILYLLLQEKNVSRVALKLNQPQPSISASLRKLRELTGDPLLVRGARGMVPTQHGESLLKPAKRILDETESLFVRKSPFVPEEAARSFHIAAPDYLDTQFLPGVVASLRRGSPNSKVVIHSLGPGLDYLRMLSDGEMDLVIANWDEPPAHLHMSKLFEDPIICTMRADSPYAKRTASDAMTVEDDRLGMQRKVAVESPYFGVIPYMLTQSDLVLTTGRQFIRFYERTLPLKSFTVPIKFPPMRFYQLWHQRVHQSLEHKWLRDQVSAAARALLAR